MGCSCGIFGNELCQLEHRLTVEFQASNYYCHGRVKLGQCRIEKLPAVGNIPFMTSCVQPY